VGPPLPPRRGCRIGRPRGCTGRFAATDLPRSVLNPISKGNAKEFRRHVDPRRRARRVPGPLREQEAPRLQGREPGRAPDPVPARGGCLPQLSDRGQRVEATELQGHADALHGHQERVRNHDRDGRGARTATETDTAPPALPIAATPERLRVQSSAFRSCRVHDPAFDLPTLAELGRFTAPASSDRRPTSRGSPTTSSSLEPASAGADLVPLLRARRVLGVGSARAGSMARFPRRSLVMGILHDAVDRALLRIEIVQPVVGADRVRVFGCPGAVLRTGERNARSARRASHLTGGSGTCACARKRDSARRSCEEGLCTHIRSPF